LGKPYASVLIDTYNHEKFIEQAIVSVLEQDFPASEREILVVDDGSTDRTPEIVRKFAPQVRYLPKKNGGQASAFNAGIPECQGDVVSFLDGDDWWVKEKLETILPVFRANPDIGAVGHGCLMVDAEGVLQSTIVPDKTYRLSLKSVAEARLFTQLRPFFGTSKVAYRKSILDRVLPVPEGAIIEADEFLFTAAPCLADVIALEQPLFYYRLHAGNQFMMQAMDERGQRRKFNSLKCLLEHLPPKMRSLGAPEWIVETVLEPLSLEVEMMRLQLDGGSRRDMWRAERAAYRLDYKSRPLGYRIFKQFSLLMALAVPPRRFFQLKRWYATSGMRSLRKYIGEPAGAAPIVGEMPGK
jgi:glycosyltransferase involved in cell wall biosynthesis